MRLLGRRLSRGFKRLEWKRDWGNDGNGTVLLSIHYVGGNLSYRFRNSGERLLN